MEKTIRYILPVISLLSGESLCAETADSSSSATGLLLGRFPGEDAWDQTWSAFTLYKNFKNPILQEFALQGRYQAQFAVGESSVEDYKRAGKGEFIGDDIENRRAIFGFKSRWFEDWRLEGQIDIDTDGEDLSRKSTFYRDIYELYLTYSHSDAFNAGAGKREVRFTREQEISSKEIVTIERSGITNMLYPGELTGVWINGKGIEKHWRYELGVYGNDRQREFSELNDGAIILGKIGYDYSDLVGADSAVVTIYYMHNTEPGVQYSNDSWSGSASPSFTDSISLGNDITIGKFNLVSDIVYAFGFDGNAEQKGKMAGIHQPDVFGISVIPSYYLTKEWQLVTRAQFASSSSPDGLKTPGRYEESSLLPSDGDTKGNSYISLYAGVNYYIYGNKLKLMNGAEYTHMGGGDYNGTTFYSALRMSF